MITIAERLNFAYARIAKAEKKYHRNSQSVALLAVSKKKPTNLILEAYQNGQRAFGESYVQEAVDKINELKHLDIQWHFIGPIQSNKTALIAQHFAWVQSVSRAKIATRLSQQRDAALGKLNVLIQVNIDEEQSKSGCTLSEVNELARHIAQQDNLTLRGLMAIPQKRESSDQQSHSFARLNACFQELKAQYTSVDTLSIGMSNDAEIAIAQGSTMVRIGTDIFGAREN